MKLLAPAVLAAAVLVPAGTAYATPVGPVHHGGVTVQCTRQYRVDADSLTLRSSPGGNPLIGLRRGDKFNKDGESGGWYRGHAYDGSTNAALGYGWVQAAYLSYTGICF